MLHFPGGFRWGSATAAHQIEGNNVNTDWWAREHASGTTIEEPSGDACDSYHRYREDMQVLADAGLGMYRFSLEWARIEPEKGFVSRAELDHYRRMVDTARELGIEPMVTLHHFTIPRWFESDGGWLAPDAVDRFARFTEAALPVLDGVEWVCTINEPNMVAMFAGTDPAAVDSGAGAHTTMQAFGQPAPNPRVADTLLAAHRAARDVLGAAGPFRSGWTVATQDFQPEPGWGSYAPTFGLVAVDRETFVRAVRPSASWLGEVARANAVESSP